MKEPKRLLSHGATDFERQLLRAVANERPSALLRSRMQRGLGLVGPLAWASSVKAMVGSIASKVTGGVALSTIVAVGGIAAVSLTPGSNVLTSQARPAVTETRAEPSSSATRVEPRGTPNALQPIVEPAPVAELATEPRLSGTAARNESDRAPESDSLEAPATTTVPAALAERDTGAEAGSDPHDAKQAVEQDDDGRLREEIALLDAARTSLQHGERESARVSLRTYRERFPAGILRREAGLLLRRAEGRRAVGHRAEAKRARASER
jgi:hypothetical protein